MKAYFMRNFTEEQRKQGQLVRAQKRAEMMKATKDYKKDWMDENWWLELANSRGFRLPPYYVPATAQSLKKWARKLSKTPFSEHFGCDPQGLIRRNPKVPLRVFVGQMLEP